MKLQPEYETECYLTESGYYAIKQPHTLGEEDQIVLLSRSQVEKVVADMQLALDLVLPWAGEGEQ